ncbi:hypothetical protein DMH01_15385 [Amycolatopsis sp. WAC 04182]|uniref:peptidase inhibitor family I36 protein n=1 Tax=Amycolatopsis sp. WAC 04182 TaxID=2203198 RepID=UPI0010013D6F|nr:hypothetical protein DMH01_15385 [Amycolatopsis sp. WAC 04182]
MCFRNILSVAVAITPLGAVPPAATAHPATVSVGSYANCPAGRLCAWDGPGETGKELRTQVSIPDLGAVGMDNQISSLWNRTGVEWCAYLEPHYVGAASRIGNWRGSLTGSSNNAISSLRRGC